MSLERALATVRRRLRFAQTLRRAVLGAALVAPLGACLAAARIAGLELPSAAWLPFEALVFGPALLGAAVGALLGARERVSAAVAAAVLEHGSGRGAVFTTALELSGSQHPWAGSVQREAEQALAGLDVREATPLRWPRRGLRGLGAVLLLTAILLQLPPLQPTAARADVRQPAALGDEELLDVRRLGSRLRRAGDERGSEPLRRAGRRLAELAESIEERTVSRLEALARLGDVERELRDERSRVGARAALTQAIDESPTLKQALTSDPLELPGEAERGELQASLERAADAAAGDEALASRLRAAAADLADDDEVRARASLDALRSAVADMPPEAWDAAVADVAEESASSLEAVREALSDGEASAPSEAAPVQSDSKGVRDGEPGEPDAEGTESSDEAGAESRDDAGPEASPADPDSSERGGESDPESSGETEASDPDSSERGAESDPESSGETEAADPDSSERGAESDPESSGGTEAADPQSSERGAEADPESSGGTEAADPESRDGETEAADPDSSERGAEADPESSDGETEAADPDSSERGAEADPESSDGETEAADPESSEAEGDQPEAEPDPDAGGAQSMPELSPMMLDMAKTLIENLDPETLKGLAESLRPEGGDADDGDEQPEPPQLPSELPEGVEDLIRDLDAEHLRKLTEALKDVAKDSPQRQPGSQPDLPKELLERLGELDPEVLDKIRDLAPKGGGERGDPQRPRGSSGEPDEGGKPAKAGEARGKPVGESGEARGKPVGESGEASGKPVGESGEASGKPVGESGEASGKPAKPGKPGQSSGESPRGETVDGQVAAPPQPRAGSAEAGNGVGPTPPPADPNRPAPERQILLPESLEGRVVGEDAALGVGRAAVPFSRVPPAVLEQAERALEGQRVPVTYERVVREYFRRWRERQAAGSEKQ